MLQVLCVFMCIHMVKQCNILLKKSYFNIVDCQLACCKTLNGFYTETDYNVLLQSKYFKMGISERIFLPGGYLCVRPSHMNNN